MFRTVGERSPTKLNRQGSKKGSTGPINDLVGWLTGGGGIMGRSRPLTKSRSAQLRVDIPMLLVVITLLIFGILMVYSASYDYSFYWYDNRTEILVRQVIWLLLGCAGATALVFSDYHIWRRLSVFAMGATIILLLSVLVVHDTRNGAMRTIWDGSIQPSELAKFMTVVYLAVWLHSKQDDLSDMNFGLFPLAGILGILGGLIVLQPDFSAVLTVLMLGGFMFFLAGGDLRQIIVLILAALLVGLLVVLMSDKGAQRIQDYWLGLVDPINASDHVRLSFHAFVRGRWFGVGLGNGITKNIGLPVPPTDSIFAVVGEELGFVGAVTLISLYIILLWRGFYIAGCAPDQLGALLAGGLTLWIAVEAFMNMAVMVNILPFAGNALPFISAGGSSLITTMLAIGIILNISRVSVAYKEESERSNNAVVDLRGRDRRRSLSSHQRSASHKRRTRK
jgi:cell division protein FtsW